MSSSASSPPVGHHAMGESSSRAGTPSRDAEDDSASDEDPVTNHARDQTLLSGDPLESALNTQISFKRKKKPPSRLGLAGFLSSPFSQNARSISPSPQRLQSRAQQLREQSSRNNSNLALGGHSGSNGSLNDQKDGGPLDWYVEGPGRRVGYDDLTAIDWIFEYTKERQRLRVLYSNTPGIVGSVRQLLDASHVWLILIFTGIAVGVLAACIDIAGDWLGDIKTGYCKNGPGGGRFYLNKSFCCWGHDEWAQCRDWTPWRTALRINSPGGGYVVEYIFYILFSVLFAACASVLVKSFATYAKHSGIPEIKTVLGGFVIRRFMGGWTLVVKSLGLCLAVASGLWLGKEGPLVHVACCCANMIMKAFDTVNKNEARKREVLSAAAASGISVAFGSPLGGVLFSLEQLSYYFPDKTMWQSFVCAMVAAVTLQALNPFRTGKIVLYQVTYSHGWHGFEIIAFIILGVLGGLYGAMFIKLNMRIATWRRNVKPIASPVLEVVAVTLLSAIINFPNIFMRAQTSELVYSLFAECASLTDDPFGLCKTSASSLAKLTVLLVLAAVLGFLLASLTFGLEIPAGIILPSLAIGALYGRALGIIAQSWQQAHPDFPLFATCEPDVQCITPGTYAIIGAASALGGATRMTVSIVVIMFELTGALTYVLPIMIAVMLSKWIGDAFGHRGIYESWIHFKEYPFLDQADSTPIPDVPATQIMTRTSDLTTLPAVGHTIASLTALLNTTPYRGYPIIASRDHPILLGYISRTELAFALKTATSPPRNLPPETQTYFSHQPLADPRDTLDLRPWMDQTPITLNVASSLQLTVNMFQKLGLRYILFVRRGELQGLLTKKDIWFVLDGAEAGGTRVNVGNGGNGFNGYRGYLGAGVLREEGEEAEERGLLSSRTRDSSGDEDEDEGSLNPLNLTTPVGDGRDGGYDEGGDLGRRP